MQLTCTSWNLYSGCYSVSPIQVPPIQHVLKHCHAHKHNIIYNILYIYIPTQSKTILGHPSWQALPGSWGVKSFYYSIPPLISPPLIYLSSTVPCSEKSKAIRGYSYTRVHLQVHATAELVITTHIPLHVVHTTTYIHSAYINGPCLHDYC